MSYLKYIWEKTQTIRQWAKVLHPARKNCHCDRKTSRYVLRFFTRKDVQTT